MHAYMTECQIAITEKRKQGVECDIPKFGVGDVVRVLANRATRRVKNIHAPWVLDATIHAQHPNNEQYYKLR